MASILTNGSLLHTGLIAAAANARGMAQIQVKFTIINVNVKIIKGPMKIFPKSTSGYVTAS